MAGLEEESLGAFQAGQAMRRLFRYTEGRRGVLAACVVGSLVASAIQILLPLLMRQGVDVYMAGSGIPQERAHGLLRLAGEYALMLVGFFVISAAVNWGLNWLAQQVVMAIRRDVFEHLHRLPIPYFDRNPVGRLVTRVANDADALSEVFASVVAAVMGEVLLLVGIVAIMFRLDGRLALLVLTLFPLLAVLTVWFRNASGPIYRQIRVLLARINAFFQESVQGIAVVKSFVAEARMADRFQAMNLEYFKTEMSLVYVLAVFRPLVGSASTIGIAMVLWQGGHGVLAGVQTLGTMVAFLTYVKMLFSPIDELAEKVTLFQQAMVAAERIFRILDTAPEEVPAGGTAAPRLRGHVRFEDVTFAYDPEKPVLRGVSFEVRPGETVALVGPTGSGKTTITALLLGFYAIDGNGSGRILVDDIPLEQWDPAALRRQIGLVQQDLFLFRTDLEHNVSLFTDPPPHRVQEALAASQASRIVEKYPEGLSYRLTERGASLSQGERQLLSFARALVSDPPLLLLDEATASVDSLTEKAIQDALHRILEQRTALIVAHRLSTVQEADRILVLKQGRIVEQGTHAELLSQNGLYAHLFRTQQLDPQG